MSTYLQSLIDRYKRMRTEQYLSQTYQCLYAFVGMGQHSLTNLYPVLHYLGVPLRYICVTSQRKARLIGRKYPDIKVTTSLDDVLNDAAIRGVFVSASPTAHFHLASRILEHGKSLFIEKPPCRSLMELDELIRLQRLHRVPVAMAGLQKRHAPAVQFLKTRLQGGRLINYDLHYLTGAYPEGDALTDLFIHPLDLVCHLFGPSQIIAHQRLYGTRLLMLRHRDITGTLELSTAHSWTSIQDTLTVSTHSALYRLSLPDQLTYTPKPHTLLGIPQEKVFSRNFPPTFQYAPLPHPSAYSQGYFGELSSFVRAVEQQNDAHVLGTLTSLRTTYVLTGQIRNAS